MKNELTWRGKGGGKGGRGERTGNFASLLLRCDDYVRVVVPAGGMCLYVYQEVFLLESRFVLLFWKLWRRGERSVTRCNMRK